MSETRRTEPTQATQGEQIEWQRSFDDYPATQWTGEYRFRGPGTGFNITATADGTDFVAILTAVASAAAAVGTWNWQFWVTNIADTSIKMTIQSGVIKFLRGFATGTLTAVELRTAAKQTLDSIDAALATIGTSDVAEYEITTPAGGRKVRKSSKTELLSMRKYYAGIVSRENAAERVRNGKPFAQQIKVTMRER